MNPLHKLSQGRKATRTDTQIANSETQLYLVLDSKRQRLLGWLRELRSQLEKEARQQNEGEVR